jgi:hypothetical protein
LVRIDPSEELGLIPRVFETSVGTREYTVPESNRNSHSFFFLGCSGSLTSIFKKVMTTKRIS